MSTQHQTQDEIIKDQLAARAKRAGNVAAATGNVAKGAFLATITGSKTVGEKAVVFSSLAGIVAFFLPWVTVGGTLSMSGLRVARYGPSIVWLYPISMILCFIAAWLLLDATPRKRILAARWLILVGTLWVAPGIAAVCNMLSAVAGFGIYVATAAAAGILLGGFLQISHELGRLNDTGAE